jgi:hypothetical protein
MCFSACVRQSQLHVHCTVCETHKHYTQTAITKASWHKSLMPTATAATTRLYRVLARFYTIRHKINNGIWQMLPILVGSVTLAVSAHVCI